MLRIGYLFLIEMRCSIGRYAINGPAIKSLSIGFLKR